MIIVPIMATSQLIVNSKKYVGINQKYATNTGHLCHYVDYAWSAGCVNILGPVIWVLYNTTGNIHRKSSAVV